MKKLILLLSLTFASCHHNPVAPGPGLIFGGEIIAHVYFQNQNLSGKKVMLLETQETGTTNADGRFSFTVKPGHYTLRAYDINRGGPAHRDLDFEVMVQQGEIKIVDIFDCLACV